MNTPFVKYFFLVFLILSAFWLRVFNLASTPPGVSRDEGLNVVDSFNMSRGAFYPFYEDHEEPEPLYKLLLSVTVRFFGPSIFSYRLTSAFIGLLTVASAYWALFQMLSDLSIGHRRFVAFVGALSLAVSLGHITLSRHIYRAILQPLFTYLFLGFLALGFRRFSWFYFILSGSLLGIGLYTYTAALLLPLAILVILVGVLLQYSADRSVLSRYFGFVISFLLVAFPVIFILLFDSGRILARSSDIASNSYSISYFFRYLWRHLVVSGDPNPQYNAASSALISPYLVVFFVLGFFVLVWRFRSSWVAVVFVGLLLLASVPSIFSDEPVHGLRFVGEYVVFPFFVALGALLISFLLSYFRSFYSYLFLFLFASICLLSSFSVYYSYWRSGAGVWSVYQQSLTGADWFFRPDKRDVVSRWVIFPYLVSFDYLSLLTTRSNLLVDFPEITLTSDDIKLSPETRVFIPWLFEEGAFLSDTRLYALLQDGQITLLPPLTAASHQQLIEDFEQSTPLIHEGGLGLLGYSKEIPRGFDLEYEPVKKMSINAVPIASFGNGQVIVEAWRGPYTIVPEDHTLTYFIDWSATRQLQHHYSAFVQLQTQAYETIAGQDKSLWRWIYPSTMWRPGENIPSEFELSLPDQLSPGAYRLVTGVYYIWGQLDAASALVDTVSNMATIGWIKVPQAGENIPQSAHPIDGILGDTFALDFIDADIGEENNSLQINLYWHSLVDRPETDATIFIHVMDENGQIVAQQDARPWNGQYPTFIWDAQETVRTDYIIDLPTQNVENLKVMVGMYTFPDLQRLAAVQDGIKTSDDRIFVGTWTELNQLGK